MKEQCDKLVGQIDCLTAELDIHKMEISRQEDVINHQQTELNALKVKLAASLEQIEVYSIIQTLLTLPGEFHWPLI